MARSANMEGAAMMSAAMTAFTFNDVLFKLLNESLPFFQVLFLRSLTVVILLFFLSRGLAWRWPEWGDAVLIGIRTLAEVAAAYFFLTALVHMPIANVTAVMQALPLTVALGAALFLGEPIGWRRLSAIGIGLIGVLIILRPGSDVFDFHAIYAVICVICVTIRDLAARRISPTTPSIHVAIVAIVGVTGFAAFGAASGPWQSMSFGQGAMLFVGSGFVLVGYLFSVMAMRVGEIGFVSPFRYTGLLVALVLGFVIFGEWPDYWTLLGAGIVVATGLFTLWRETKIRAKIQPG